MGTVLKNLAAWMLYTDRLMRAYAEKPTDENLKVVCKKCGLETIKIFAPERYFSPEQLKEFPAMEIINSIKKVNRVSDIVRIIYDYIDSYPVVLKEEINGTKDPDNKEA